MGISHRRTQRETTRLKKAAHADTVDDVKRYRQGCARKKRYGNRDLALAHLRRLQAMPYDMEHPNSGLGIYRCEFCAYFHVGHNQYTNRQSATAVASGVELIGEAERVAVILALAEGESKDGLEQRVERGAVGSKERSPQ